MSLSQAEKFFRSSINFKTFLHVKCFHWEANGDNWYEAESLKEVTELKTTFRDPKGAVWAY